jgi:cell wall-associated NlpC family hydrolase
LLAQGPSAIDSTAIAVSAADTSSTHIVEINRLIFTAEKHLGTPYRYGGKKPGGFDCSGFVLYCYGSTLGIKLPASATEYTKYGKAITRDSARPGDVICFKGYSTRSSSIGHVGMITEVTPTEIHFIHSASHGGIRYDKLSQQYYTTRFLGIRRILN